MKNLVTLLSLLFASLASYSQCSELFISEYVEGNWNNKAIEIYNPTGSAINLGSYRLVRYDNGSSAPIANEFMPLPAVDLASHSVYVIVINTSDVGTDTIPFTELAVKADTMLTTSCDPTTSTLRVMCFNGDDALSLDKNVGGNWTKVDIFGIIGERPSNGSGTYSPAGAWTDQPNYYNGVGPYWTQDHTLIRKHTVMGGVTTAGVPYNVPGEFNPATQWDSLPMNTFDSLRTHTCDCGSAGIKAASRAESGFVLYPNPASNGSVTISQLADFTNYEVSDILGNKVWASITKNSFGNYTLDTHTLSPGVYLIRFTFGSGSSATRRFSIR